MAKRGANDATEKQILQADDKANEQAKNGSLKCISDMFHTSRPPDALVIECLAFSAPTSPSSMLTLLCILPVTRHLLVPCTSMKNHSVLPFSMSMFCGA